MIHSSSVEGHHFLTSRRRGYDPAEVDAVIKRLVATLRRYEARDQAQTEDGITDLEAARLARASSADAAAMQQQAVTELNEATLRAQEMLAAAQEDAEQIVESARADAATLSQRRAERSEALITSALSEVKKLRARSLQEANDYRDAKKAEAASVLHTAELTAEELVEEARHEAGSILGRARREHAELERRLAQLRSAIAGIEGQFRYLAESTLEQTEIMASMISLETEPIEDVVDEKTPEVVRLTQQGLTIDLTDAESGGEGPHRGDRFVVSDSSTIYQRRSALRRRLEEEDVHELGTEPAKDAPA